MLQILCFLSLSAFSNCNNNKVFLTYSNESSGDMNSYISYQSVTYVSKLYAEKSGINPGIGNGGNSAFICSDSPRQKHDITEFYKWNFCSKYKQNTAETTFECHSRSSKWHGLTEDVNMSFSSVPWSAMLTNFPVLLRKLWTCIKGRKICPRIPSHPMLYFILAADLTKWILVAPQRKRLAITTSTNQPIQCRTTFLIIVNMRKSDTLYTSNYPSLRIQTARKVCRAVD